MVDFFSRKAKAARKVARETGQRAVVRGSHVTLQKREPPKTHEDIQAYWKQFYDNLPVVHANRFVTFMSRAAAEEITDPNVAVISITGKYDNTVKFAEGIPVLHMSFGTWGDGFSKQFDEVDHRAIMTFIDSHPDKNIVVHCGEGRMRSPAIADGIEHATDMKINLDYPKCPGAMGGMDRGIYRAFVGFTFQMQVNADNAERAEKA